MNESWTAVDDAVEEVRAIRRQISARFEKQFADRLVDPRTWRKGKSAA
jgi:hypothetical protein